MIQVEEVIITDMNRKGIGQDASSPVRAVKEIYTKEGALIAANDPFGNYSIEQMLDFGQLCRQEEIVPTIELFRRWNGG